MSIKKYLKIFPKKPEGEVILTPIGNIELKGKRLKVEGVISEKF